MGKLQVGVITFNQCASEDDYRLLVLKGIASFKTQGAELCLLPGRLDRVWTGTRSNFIDFHCELAHRYKIFICAGSFPAKEGPDEYIESLLIDDRGEIKGGQRQTHFIVKEERARFNKSERLACVSTPWGKMGLVVGDDIFFPEVSRILALQGAGLVLAPTVWRRNTRFPARLVGMWREVQQNQFFGLEASFKPKALAGVYVPCEYTADKTGVLTWGNSSTLVVLDFHGLDRAREAFPVLKQLNREFFACKLYYRPGSE